jgi:Ser/Thr protein kinase RdoA (MazF antagonist)
VGSLTTLDFPAALARWPLEVASCVLAAERENIVYRVQDAEGRAFALRIHRAGYRSAAEIQSELLWMAELEKNGVSVPKPLASRAGGYIENCDGILVSILTWLPGRHLGEVSMPLQIDDRVGTFQLFGMALAKLHAISDRWTKPESFVRPAWDIDGLTGPSPVWGPYWENPALCQSDRDIIVAARDRAKRALQEKAEELDFGLIHADVVRENVLLEGDKVKFIDFDDCGYGFRLFDVATALLKNRQEPDYPALQSALLAGYRSVRPLRTELFPAFLMLRAFTYLGWIIPRLHEKDAEVRNVRNLQASLGLARDYLK